MKILPSKYRYHLFFIGVMSMCAAGFFQKYLKMGEPLVITLVGAGFLLFVASIALP